MRIVVCVKAVPSTTEVKMDPKTHTIVRDGRAAVVNPFDASALELAFQLREALTAETTDANADTGASTDGRDRRSDCEIAVLSMGIPDTARLLRDCIARGADRALLLSDRAFAGADTLATAYALTCGIKLLGGADLVLCGKMAVDGDTAQIGPELAGALDMPCVTDVREVADAAADRLQLWHGCDAGTELVEVGYPAVLTVAKEAAQLRMPSIAGVRAAESADVMVATADEASADPARIGLAGSPTQVVRSFVPERSAAGVAIEGTAVEQATQLVALMGEML